MKKILLATALATLACHFASEAAERVDAVSESHSSCKLLSRSDAAEEDEDFPESWNIEYSDGILSVTWVNFFANCCPTGFVGWFEKEGNELTYNLIWTEDDEFACDCMCNFDVTTTFGAIAPGHYTITFRRYVDIFTAEVDIKDGGNITLSASPAGIQPIGTSSDIMTISADGVLRVNCEGNYTVEIFDAAGMQRVHIDAADSSEISVASLLHGMYIAKVTAGGCTSTLRFIR